MDTISLKKIGEVADLLGTTPRALRFYEEEGLVAARRTSGGTRLYSKEDIARFRAILRLAHAGVPLSLIKELATAREKFTSGAQASQEKMGSDSIFLFSYREPGWVDNKRKRSEIESDPIVCHPNSACFTRARSA